jgi:hypothetical protein
VEHFDGRMEILHWSENRQLSLFDGYAGAREAPSADTPAEVVFTARQAAPTQEPARETETKPAE